MTMGRSWQYVTAWMAATAAAVTVSWLGVQVGVAPALTSEAPVAIDVDRRYTEVRLASPEAAPGPGVTPAASTRPTSSPSPAPSAAPSAAAPSAATRSAATSAAATPSAPSRPAGTRSARTPSATAAPPAAEARPLARAAPSPSQAAAPDRRPRYRIPAQGGVVTVAYSATRVDVVATAPVAGYTVAVDRRGERLLVVRLAGRAHASVVTVYWLGGPGARIMEENTR